MAAGRRGQTGAGRPGRGQRPQGAGAGAGRKGPEGRAAARKGAGRLASGRRQDGHGSAPRGAGRGSGRTGSAQRGQRRPERRRESDLIEGRRACAEALEVGVPIRRALVAETRGEQDATLERLVHTLEGAGVRVEEVPRARLDKLSSHGAHQGIMLETEPFSYATFEDVVSAAGEGDALVVLLDHVTDEGNFGAIVRSAEVVGAAGVVVANARAARVGTAAYKTSAGAVLHVPIARVANLARAIDELKDAGFWVGAASEHARDDVWHAPVEGRFCLVMGSEGEGVSQLVLRACDFTCRLPQRGRVESLNVAQAATVMCYEWLRREELAEAPSGQEPGGRQGAGREGDAPGRDGLQEGSGGDV